MDIQPQASASPQGAVTEEPKESGVGGGWVLFKKSFSYLFQKPVFLVPIFACWLVVASLILYLRYYWIAPAGSGLAFLEIYGFIFAIAYVICLANLVLLELMYQVDNNQPVSLSRAFAQMVSLDALKAVPIAVFFSIVWFIILILRAIKSKEKNKSSHEPSLRDAAMTLGGVSGNPFSWLRLGLDMFEKLIRMTVFLSLPAIAWDDKGAFSAFGKAIEIIKKRPVQFLTTYALTGIAALIMALPLVPIFIANKADIKISSAVWLTVIIYEGIIWTLGIYLEQMSVASLYLWYTKQTEVAGLEEGFSSMAVSDLPGDTNVVTATVSKPGAAWSGASIGGGIIFVYITCALVLWLGLAVVQISPDLAALISLLVSVAAIFLGSMFGVKYVVTRADIKESDITKISIVAALIPTIVNLISSAIGVGVYSLFADSESLVSAAFQNVMISLASILLIFIATFIFLKKYINSPKDHHYITDRHMYALLLIIVVTLGLRYAVYAKQKTEENKRFMDAIYQKYGTPEQQQQEQQKLQNELNQLNTEHSTAPPPAQTSPNSASTGTIPKQENPFPPAAIRSGFTGTVSSETGELIVGAKIKFTSADGKINKETTSDTSGRYEILLPAGKYSVLATYPGFEFRSYPGYFIATNSVETANIEMTAK